MDEALETLIELHGFRARQMLLPTGVAASPRLDKKKLPVVEFKSLFEKEIEQSTRGDLVIKDATKKTAAMLLGRNFSDRSMIGPALRKAHHQAGRYLALNYVAEIIGVELTPGAGHQLLHENRTSIVACGRPGEPLADGISEAFPLAKFYHSVHAEDIQDYWLKGHSTALLVTAAIFDGDTIMKYVQRIRQLHRSIRVIVVTSLVQDKSVKRNGKIEKCLNNFGNLHIVMFHRSTANYPASLETGIGDRLFNTDNLKN